jgi:hypothetical protein
MGEDRPRGNRMKAAGRNHLGGPKRNLRQAEVRDRSYGSAGNADSRKDYRRSSLDKKTVDDLLVSRLLDSMIRRVAFRHDFIASGMITIRQFAGRAASWPRVLAADPGNAKGKVVRKRLCAACARCAFRESNATAKRSNVRDQEGCDEPFQAAHCRSALSHSAESLGWNENREKSAWLASTIDRS